MFGTLINLVQECVRLSLIKDPIWPLLSIDLALTKALKKVELPRIISALPSKNRANALWFNQPIGHSLINFVLGPLLSES